jgi:hypothetical protein
MPRSFEWPLAFRLSIQNFVCTSHHPHVCHMPCPYPFSLLWSP